MASQNIKALFVFEILGRPPEHIKKALSGMIDLLGKQKGIKIIRREVHKPKPFEKDGKVIQNLFTTFAEVELIADNLSLIFDVTMNMLPAHVEIIEPKTLEFKNFDLTSIVSNLAIKIHRYDEIAKAITLEKNSLTRRLEQAQGKTDNFVEEIKKPKKPAKPKKKTKPKKKKK